MRETWVRLLGWEDALEKEMATHSSTLAWKIPWMEVPGKPHSTVSQKSDTTGQLHSCFSDDPVNVGNLISGSSAFPKSSLNIWKFTVHILLKPGLKNFKYYFASI